MKRDQVRRMLKNPESERRENSFEFNNIWISDGASAGQLLVEKMAR